MPPPTINTFREFTGATSSVAWDSPAPQKHPKKRVFIGIRVVSRETTILGPITPLWKWTLKIQMRSTGPRRVSGVVRRRAGASVRGIPRRAEPGSWAVRDSRAARPDRRRHARWRSGHRFPRHRHHGGSGRHG